MKIRVENLMNDRGNRAANQFVITIGEIKVFQS